MVKQISRKEFENEVLKSKEIVLVDFYADWCGPCKMLSPIMDKISEDIKVYKVNVDENQELASELGIMSIPCVIGFANGEETKRSVGLKSKQEMLDTFR